MTDGPIKLNEVTRAAVDSGRLVQEGGAVDALRKITNGQFPPPGDNYPEGFVTRISPRKISGTGPWGLAD
jgi:hypothetical protein